jgi:insertion element IS1 protein InsB
MLGGEMPMRVCPKCQRNDLIKNGSAAGKPEMQCKRCGYQFTRTTPRSKSLRTKVSALLWYLSGISMNRIGTLLWISAQAVLNWIRTFTREHYEKPEPTGKAILLQLDKMWHYVKNKRHKLWIWKALDGATGQLLDWKCGHRDKAPLRKLVDRLDQGDVRFYHTDRWGTYASVLPQDKLMQSKAGTHRIERNRCRQRHWFGRFKRKSILVSKSKEIVDLTTALFAKFWVNGNQEELISLLD